MMWVSLAFLVVFMVAVVAFRLGYTTGRNSMSDMIGTNGDLGLGLLDAVLAEVAHAGGEGLTHGLDRLRLAHRDEAHVPG